MSHEQRFWGYVDKSAGQDACWPWTMCKGERGYGSFTMNRKTYRAHRLAWEFANGPIPEGKFICHHCDNKVCCNPIHLYAGTHRENMDDIVSRKIMPKYQPAKQGERHPFAKLSNSQAIEIRIRIAAGEKNADLAREYRVNPSTIANIKAGRNWSHVTGEANHLAVLNGLRNAGFE